MKRLVANLKLNQIVKSRLRFGVIFFGIIFQAYAQQDFDPNLSLDKLSTTKGNIGISAGYSVNGEVKWSNSSGLACLQDDKAFSSKTLTRIASISKSMTAIAIMQLVERNLIDLDISIQNYIPGFPKKEKGDIMVRQLLAHTSGVSQYKGEKEIENTIHYSSLHDAMNVFINRPLLFEPGTEYFYTTYGYVILGRIIEKVSGVTFEEYMQEHIWNPADMNNTGIEWVDRYYENKSCLYHKGKRKTKEGAQNDLSNRIPGGGFYSTMEDIMKFGQAVLDQKLISDSTFQKMLESQPVTYDGNKYGLGWFFYGPAPNENLVIGHSGGQTGCTSQLMIIPISKTVVVVLSNTSGTYPDIATFASNLIGFSESEQRKAE